MNPMKMKLNICRVMVLLLTIALLVAMLPMALAANASGSCGANVQWTLQSGKLIISGEGPMTNYNQWDLPPWYAERENIHCVQVNAGVTSIGELAFYNLVNLESVTLPDTVKNIEKNAFHLCEKLSQIRLGSGVTSIGISAFEGCRALHAVQLPQGLISIGDRAFYRCEALGGITIPSTVTELGNMVFGYCYRLAYARILAPVKALPDWFFYGCLSLAVVHLPQSVESIENKALSECPKLEQVNYTGSTQVQEQIQEQLEEPTTLGGDQPDRTVEYQETENSVIITTDTYYNMTEEGDFPPSDKEIYATVTGDAGWKEVAQVIENELKNCEDPDPVVQVEVQADVKVDAGALQNLVNQDVTIQIHTSENSSWQLDMSHQTAETLQNGQEVSVELNPYQPTDAQKETVGEAPSYTLNLGNTNWNTTVLIPMGQDTARDVASLYWVDDSQNLTLIQSVIVDNSGKAAFSLAGTVAGTYLLALNAPNVPQEEVRVPEALYKEYGIDGKDLLMGMDGNYYAITGQSSSLGFDIGMMTWIIIGVLVFMAIAVGGVMFLLNKRKLQMGYVPDYDDDEDEEE